jgi:hypothetical protein
VDLHRANQRGSYLILVADSCIEAPAGSVATHPLVEMTQLSAFTFGGPVHQRLVPVQSGSLNARAVNGCIDGLAGLSGDIFVADKFKIMSVRIEYKCRVIVLMIMGPKSWSAVARSS